MRLEHRDLGFGASLSTIAANTAKQARIRPVPSVGSPKMWRLAKLPRVRPGEPEQRGVKRGR